MLRACWRSSPQSFGLVQYKSTLPVFASIPIYRKFSSEETVLEKETEPNYSVSPKLALPSFVAGRWRQPRLSGRRIAVIKKQFRGQSTISSEAKDQYLYKNFRTGRGMD